MQISITGTTTPNIWQIPRASTAQLRIYANQRFHTSDGKIVIPGTPGLQDFYRAATLTETGGVITIPTIAVDSTEDSLTNQLATYSALIYSSIGNRLFGTLLDRFTVPPEVSPVTTWTALEIHKQGVLARRDDTTYTKSQIENLIAIAIASLSGSVPRLSGPATLSAGSVTTVACILTEIDSRIVLAPASETITGNLHVTNRVAGVSFDVYSDNGADAGDLTWFLW